jgi:hypothetical protein
MAFILVVPVACAADIGVTEADAVRKIKNSTSGVHGKCPPNRFASTK